MIWYGEIAFMLYIVTNTDIHVCNSNTQKYVPKTKKEVLNSYFQ